LGASHPQIELPPDLFGSERRNSAGMDLASEQQLAALARAFAGSGKETRRAAPLIHSSGKRAAAADAGIARSVCNPADHRDVVGFVVESSPGDVDTACAQALAALPQWSTTPPGERAAALERAADLLEERPALLGLIVREAGKSLPNAIAEVREAVDFLRYYGAQVRASFHNDTHRALCASRRGIFRSPYSWARWPRRWPPGTRCSPSPRKKRR
jgi:RHH-type proline utilization regulon transcriptional repressor/proline dehydrogenase/delta 1-pyrroline-5-carboxylate dehydrogenase